jgi:hypothetical protein
MRIRLRLFHVVLLSLPLTCCLVAGAILLFFDYDEHDRLQLQDKYLSQSIPNDVVTDLCSRNLIPTAIGDCQNKNLQIQLRSIPAIFRANIASDATESDVNQLFSAYLLGCKDDRDIPHSVRCQYEVAGNIVAAINYSSDTHKVVSMSFDS